MTGLCKKDCSKCTLKDICGGCSLCEASLCSNNCSMCFSICPKRSGAFEYLDRIGGANLELLSNEFLKDIELPGHIPILPDKLKDKLDSTLVPVIGIHGGNMLSSNGEGARRSYKNKGYKRALNLDDSTKGVLEFYVKDRTLEGLWDRRYEIYPDLKAMDLSLVIAPNFSVYDDSSRIDHLYNIKRSSTIYNEMIKEGINAVPDISWHNLKDLKRWIKAINRYNIKLIAFSFQVVGVNLKASTIWKQYLPGFRYLCENIPGDVSIIIAGIVSQKRVAEVFKSSAGQRIHILNQSAYIQSRRGTVSETREQDRNIPLNKLLTRNIKYFSKVYDKLSRGDEIAQDKI